VNIVGRLSEEGLVDASSETQIDLKEPGLAYLATHPLVKLAAAISTLPPETQTLLAEALEAVQGSLVTAARRPH
jgi:hypothetical protein